MEQIAEKTLYQYIRQTNYWLRLIADVNPGFKDRMQDLMQECKEIVKIVSTIMLNAKKNQ